MRSLKINFEEDNQTTELQLPVGSEVEDGRIDEASGSVVVEREVRRSEVERHRREGEFRKPRIRTVTLLRLKGQHIKFICTGTMM